MAKKPSMRAQGLPGGVQLPGGASIARLVLRLTARRRLVLRLKVRRS